MTQNITFALFNFLLSIQHYLINFQIRGLIVIALPIITHVGIVIAYRSVGFFVVRVF